MRLAKTLSPLRSRLTSGVSVMPQIVIRVRLEPRLEEIAGDLPPEERRRMASLYYRWAKQLWLSADVLEPRPRPGPPRRYARPALPPKAPQTPKPASQAPQP